MSTWHAAVLSKFHHFLAIFGENVVDQINLDSLEEILPNILRHLKLTENYFPNNFETPVSFFKVIIPKMCLIKLDMIEVD